MQNSAMETLRGIARRNMELVEADTLDRADEVMTLSAESYFDPVRWEREIDRVFKRMPLMLALSCELREAGDFKTQDVCGVPVLLVRQSDGEVRAFINSCSHRGAVVVTESCGNRRRFSCPYHAWTYDGEGDLVKVFAEEDFGEVDRAANGLTRLPVNERAGMIWVCLDPDSPLDMNAFLCGYDDLLAQFGFADWSLFDSRTIAGPNWKLCYDGYLDLYHLPILHRETFGSSFPHQALFNAWGPHQRATSPDPTLLELRDIPENEWPTDALMQGVWTIFPHVSIASFDGGGGRGVMVSQLFPGDTPLESFTVQNYLMEKLPQDDETRKAADEQFKLLEYVVQEEDYATCLRQQRALLNRPGFQVMFGRNEGGGQHFHTFLERLVECDDADLSALFANAAPAT